MLDSIYPMTLKILKTRNFGMKSQDFLLFLQRYNGRHFVKVRNL